MSLSDRQGFRVTKARNLFILDKGKPVARPGRKTKGRRIVSVGSLVAEGVMLSRSVVSDEEEVRFYQHGALKASRGLALVFLGRRCCRAGSEQRVIPVGSREGTRAGMEEYR